MSSAAGIQAAQAPAVSGIGTAVRGDIVVVLVVAALWATALLIYDLAWSSRAQ